MLRRLAFSSMLRLLLAGWVLALVGCQGPSSAAFTELATARRLAADLRFQFTKAADASNRAVMADTDETSQVYAHEAEQATQTVQTDIDALTPDLRSLGYPAEIGLVEDFGKRFSAYRALDRKILDLAVENTNLKAQHLSFGPAREAADAFRTAIESASTPPKDACRVESLAAKAVLAVREVQVLQAPHIAESDDAAMTRMEAEMSGLEASASDALSQISALEPRAQPQLVAAAAALGRFKDLTGQIVALSRRNTNVRSLELSLRDKPALTASCDDSLRSLEEALAREGSTTGTR
jgi:hypothetical protein